MGARYPFYLLADSRDGQIKNFTGIDSPYEVPEAPDIHILAEREAPEEAAARIVDWFVKHQSRDR